MNCANAIKHTLVLTVLLALFGCVSTPHDKTDAAIAGDFGDDSLEVLFATEFPVASKEEAIAKASLAYRDGEIDKAQFYLVRALKFDVSDVDLLAQIGDLHVVQGNVVLAARAFSYALQQDAQHARSLEGLGLLFFRAGNDNKAKHFLQLAVSSDSSFWRAHNSLGVIFDRERNFDQAMTHYDAALALKPQSDSVLINRGYSYYLNNKYRDAALDFYAVAERSDSPRAWRNLAMVYARQGWYKPALETFMEAMEPAAAHNEVGAIATENGDHDEAWFYLNEALRLSPTYFASAEKNLAELRRNYSR